MTIHIKSQWSKLNDFLEKVKDMKNQYASDSYRYEFGGLEDHINTGPLIDKNSLNHFLQMKYGESNYEIEETENILWVFMYIHNDDKLYAILEKLQMRNITVTIEVRIVRRLN